MSRQPTPAHSIASTTFYSIRNAVHNLLADCTIMMVPLTPGLGKLRIASPADILRLGIVCTAGFWYSEHFHWVRPYHAQYPLDTITFFQHEVAGLLENPEFIVLAAVDAYDPQESEKTEATIPAGHGWQIPEAGEEVVVGLAVWKLEPNSKRYGQYRNDTGSLMNSVSR